MAKNDFTQNELKTKYQYNPETGLFKSKSSGNIVGAKHTNGYLIIRKLNRTHYLHRLAFLYMTGDMPDYVDHLNHDRANNKWDNLRKASIAINSKNQSLLASNKTGISGIYWSKPNRKWGVRMRCGNNKKIFLGYYDDFFEACCSRISHSVRLGFHHNHGR